MVPENEAELTDLVEALAERASAELGAPCTGLVIDTGLGPVACIGSATMPALWRWCRAEVPTTGRWPVIVGEELWMEIDDEPGTPPDDLIAEAADLDAAELLRRGATRFADGDELAFVDGPLQQEAASLESARLGAAAERGIALLPVDAGWRAAALLGLQDGGSREPAEHLAILRHFEERYGAALAETNGAVTTLVLEAPVADPDLARTAAIERIGYGDTTSGLSEYEPEEVLAATQVDTVWGFWFD